MCGWDNKMDTFAMKMSRHWGSTSGEVWMRSHDGHLGNEGVQEFVVDDFLGEVVPFDWHLGNEGVQGFGVDDLLGEVVPFYCGPVGGRHSAGSPGTSIFRLSVHKSTAQFTRWRSGEQSHKRSPGQGYTSPRTPPLKRWPQSWVSNTHQSLNNLIHSSLLGRMQ